MRQFSSLCIAMICCLGSFAQYLYPPTKTVDSSDTYFGVTYKDPYRWLEYNEQPEVESWFKQQADYTNSILNKLNGREELIAQWKKLDKLQPPRISGVSYENGRIFYRKTMPGENVGKLYFKEGLNGKEILLFDPKSYIAGKTLTMSAALPSYDGKKIAIGYSEQGAEVDVIKVMDVDTRQFMKDSIYPTSGITSWTFDNKALLYIWIKSADNKDPTSRLNPKTKLHMLGKDQSSDVDFFSNASYPQMNIDPSVYPYVYLTKDSRKYIFSGLGSVQPEQVTYYAPIQQVKENKIGWKKLSDASDMLVRGLAIIEDDAFAISYKNAKNYKLIATTMKNPDWNNAATIVAEKADRTIEYF
ncbi:MAG TPA: hypothetical protein VLR49_07165, partial [Ferruginibacter sp.]|nr:hypothetical protein [Ferruginibacter sp.]